VPTATQFPPVVFDLPLSAPTEVHKLPVVLADPALVPIAAQLLAVVFNLPALKPIAVQFSPVVLDCPALVPIAVQLPPVVLALPALSPIAVQFIPVVFEVAASFPIAVQLAPVVLSLPAQFPIAVQLEPVVFALPASFPIAVQKLFAIPLKPALFPMAVQFIPVDGTTEGVMAVLPLPVANLKLLRVVTVAVVKAPVFGVTLPIGRGLENRPNAGTVRVSSIPTAIPPSITTTRVLAVKSLCVIVELDESLTSGMVYSLRWLCCSRYW